MQPTTLSKPVMDVAAPRGPASPPHSGAQSPAAITAAPASDLAVRPAPFAAQPTVEPPKQEVPVPFANHSKPQKASGPVSANNRHTPVALITVTIFVMLVLSALAVTVYITSQTA